MKAEIRAGQCRFCRCTEDNACRLPTGEPCCWINALRICCNAPRCLIAREAELRAHERELLAARRRATRSPWPGQLRRHRELERKGKRKKRAA